MKGYQKAFSKHYKLKSFLIDLTVIVCMTQKLTQRENNPDNHLVLSTLDLVLSTLDLVLSTPDLVLSTWYSRLSTWYSRLLIWDSRLLIWYSRLSIWYSGLWTKAQTPQTIVANENKRKGRQWMLVLAVLMT